MWTQVGLISPPQKWEGSLLLGGPGLDSLLRQKLKHVPTYSGNTCVITALFSLPLCRGRGRVDVPDLLLQRGWFLDKWALSEVCLKCEDIQELLYKLGKTHSWYLLVYLAMGIWCSQMQHKAGYNTAPSSFIVMGDMQKNLKKRHSHCNETMLIWGRTEKFS